jgi:NADPH-dependent ferric siderophore reductase
MNSAVRHPKIRKDVEMTKPLLEPKQREVASIMHPLVPRMLAVKRTADVAQGMRRVVFGGDELAGFSHVHMAPDAHVKLFFPDPTTGEIVMPTLGPRGLARPAPGAPHPIYRDYTVRAFDAEKLELAIDFVVHTHGVGGAWAARARVGDELVILGPRGSDVYPIGYDWYLLGADETALPALSRWLEELPVDKKVCAFVEVVDSGSEVDLAIRPGVEVRYVHRGQVPPGNSSHLFEAIRAADFPADKVYAWVAGEANSLKAIRRYLRRDLGIDKERVTVDGYWRSGTVNLDHHDQADDD